MPELIIIGGPQAAGKTTLINQLCAQNQAVIPMLGRSRKKIPMVFPLQESRQIIVHKNILLGAIFMTPLQEAEVVECDLERMDLILGRPEDSLIYLDECNIFTIAHAKAHGVTELKLRWHEYIMRLQDLGAKVVFINVNPEVSWERRRAKYEQRLVYFPANRHKSIMKRYREYMNRLNPLLLDIYNSLPFPKEMIDGQLPESEVALEVGKALSRLSASFRSTQNTGGASCKELK